MRGVSSSSTQHSRCRASLSRMFFGDLVYSRCSSGVKSVGSRAYVGFFFRARTGPIATQSPQSCSQAKSIGKSSHGCPDQLSRHKGRTNSRAPPVRGDTTGNAPKKLAKYTYRLSPFMSDFCMRTRDVCVQTSRRQTRAISEIKRSSDRGQLGLGIRAG